MTHNDMFSRPRGTAHSLDPDPGSSLKGKKNRDTWKTPAGRGVSL